MFAVVVAGGKQYRVQPGDVVKVDKLEGEVSSVVSLEDVLLISDDEGKVSLGRPGVEGASVNAEILRHTRNDKIIVFKKTRRHNYRRKNGHRQPMTLLKIVDIRV
ncbi:MAG: 50S ribosomal protein L21 [Holosporales bacterium]|jgi:large subunit ribosomal protein L21|nr:50S ribosomal protein L21 [Holosporales bacterium]